MNDLKNLTMIVLTLVFVVLYTVALLGWLKPLSDITMVTRLEPLIFIIIGYYFGRLPGQQNEETLKEEINRQIKKAEAAQNGREKVLQEREVLEEKLKNVQKILTLSAGRSSEKKLIDNNLETLQYSINTATKVLNS